jgi:hypothetical protein
MNETEVRTTLAAELRFQHQRLIEVRRKDREIKAKLAVLYDATFWDVKRTPEEMRERSRQQDDAQNRSIASRVELAVRESAVESLRGVAYAIRGR